jgi:hypothetical protein
VVVVVALLLIYKNSRVINGLGFSKGAIIDLKGSRCTLKSRILKWTQNFD